MNRPRDHRRRPRTALALCLLALVGCQQEMARPPSYRPLEPSAFFPDGRSARPLVPGTVPRGVPLSGSPLVTGRTAGGAAAAAPGPGADRAAAAVGAGAAGPLGALPPAAASPVRPEAEFVTAFPFPVTADVLRRGQERYTIFCALCHDAAGHGRGKIVERGYLQPPSFVTDDSRGFERRGLRIPLRNVPVGYIFEVASRGFGGMPSYAEQVPPRDRWAIAAYVRTLQLAQYARLSDLPEAERRAVLGKLEKAGGEKP